MDRLAASEAGGDQPESKGADPAVFARGRALAGKNKPGRLAGPGLVSLAWGVFLLPIGDGRSDRVLDVLVRDIAHARVGLGADVDGGAALY